jgi:hypothetical protein
VDFDVIYHLLIKCSTFIVYTTKLGHKTTLHFKIHETSVSFIVRATQFTRGPAGLASH